MHQINNTNEAGYSGAQLFSFKCKPYKNINITIPFLSKSSRKIQHVILGKYLIHALNFGDTFVRVSHAEMSVQADDNLSLHTIYTLLRSELLDCRKMFDDSDVSRSQRRRAENIMSDESKGESHLTERLETLESKVENYIKQLDSIPPSPPTFKISRLDGLPKPMYKIVSNPSSSSQRGTPVVRRMISAAAGTSPDSKPSRPQTGRPVSTLHSFYTSSKPQSPKTIPSNENLGKLNLMEEPKNMNTTESVSSPAKKGSPLSPCSLAFSLTTLPAGAMSARPYTPSGLSNLAGGQTVRPQSNSAHSHAVYHADPHESNTSHYPAYYNANALGMQGDFDLEYKKNLTIGQSLTARRSIGDTAIHSLSPCIELGDETMFHQLEGEDAFQRHSRSNSHEKALSHYKPGTVEYSDGTRRSPVVPLLQLQSLNRSRPSGEEKIHVALETGNAADNMMPLTFQTSSINYITANYNNSNKQETYQSNDDGRRHLIPNHQTIFSAVSSSSIAAVDNSIANATIGVGNNAGNQKKENITLVSHKNNNPQSKDINDRAAFSSKVNQMSPPPHNRFLPTSNPTPPPRSHAGPSIIPTLNRYSVPAGHRQPRIISANLTRSPSTLPSPPRETQIEFHVAEDEILSQAIMHHHAAEEENTGTRALKFNQWRGFQEEVEFNPAERSFTNDLQFHQKQNVTTTELGIQTNTANLFFIPVVSASPPRIEWAQSTYNLMHYDSGASQPYENHKEILDECNTSPSVGKLLNETLMSFASKFESFQQSTSKDNNDGIHLIKSPTFKSSLSANKNFDRAITPQLPSSSHYARAPINSFKPTPPLRTPKSIQASPSPPKFFSNALRRSTPRRVHSYSPVSIFTPANREHSPPVIQFANNNGININDSNIARDVNMCIGNVSPLLHERRRMESTNMTSSPFRPLLAPGLCAVAVPTSKSMNHSSNNNNNRNINNNSGFHVSGDSGYNPILAKHDSAYEAALKVLSRLRSSATCPSFPTMPPDGYKIDNEVVQNSESKHSILSQVKNQNMKRNDVIRDERNATSPILEIVHKTSPSPIVVSVAAALRKNNNNIKNSIATAFQAQHQGELKSPLPNQLPSQVNKKLAVRIESPPPRQVISSPIQIVSPYRDSAAVSSHPQPITFCSSDQRGIKVAPYATIVPKPFPGKVHSFADSSGASSFRSLTNIQNSSNNNSSSNKITENNFNASLQQHKNQKIQKIQSDINHPVGKSWSYSESKARMGPLKASDATLMTLSLDIVKNGPAEQIRVFEHEDDNKLRASRASSCCSSLISANHSNGLTMKDVLRLPFASNLNNENNNNNNNNNNSISPQPSNFSLFNQSPHHVNNQLFGNSPTSQNFYFNNNIKRTSGIIETQKNLTSSQISNQQRVLDQVINHDSLSHHHHPGILLYCSPSSQRLPHNNNNNNNNNNNTYKSSTFRTYPPGNLHADQSAALTSSLRQQRRQSAPLVLGRSASVRSLLQGSSSISNLMAITEILSNPLENEKSGIEHAVTTTAATAKISKDEAFTSTFSGRRLTRPSSTGSLLMDVKEGVIRKGSMPSLRHSSSQQSFRSNLSVTKMDLSQRNVESVNKVVNKESARFYNPRLSDNLGGSHKIKNSIKDNTRPLEGVLQSKNNSERRSRTSSLRQSSSLIHASEEGKKCKSIQTKSSFLSRLDHEFS